MGVELATEWVTILPETATFVKKLKEFKPPPIPVQLDIDQKGVQKTGTTTGKTLDKTITKAAKDTGTKIPKELGKGLQNKSIQNASEKAGKVIQKEVVEQATIAGSKAGKAIATGLEKEKNAVARASRQIADARRAEENIESRIQESRRRTTQAKKEAQKKEEEISKLEISVAKRRAEAEDKAATDIIADERRILVMREQLSRQNIRISGMEASGMRLMNTRETASNRTAGAVERMATAEAALAGAMAGTAGPMDDMNSRTNRGTGAFSKMTGTLIPLGRQLLITTGLFTGALGIGGAITYVVRQGNIFTDSMNRMQGITQANEEQMAQLNQRARDLGRDFTLPATSANDAALAMLELTKAGFSVQQSIDAARGALQLSAAAGIDASEAARLTGTSLNAFGLAATDASQVTDVLANAANLFPGEMKDFGYSLSQAGAVAKSFGIDIEDTTTALGFLAKAGIKSSDAGTLIKTMLLSLTDKGKPAQEAINTLGLELYDQAGNFRGLDAVYKQLGVASKKLTQEQYQAAAATLFGTDAARFAGLAAGDAAPNWDEFRDKIDTAGTAARVADARMQGLPGAMERIKNAGQSLALTIYDGVKGPLEDIVNAIARVVLAFDDWLNTGAIGQFLKDYKEELMGVAAVLGTYVTVLAAIKIATAAWAAVQWAVNAAMSANPITLIVVAIAALVAGVIYAYKHFDWFKNAVDGAWSFIKQSFATALPVIKLVFAAIGTAISQVWNNVLKPFGAWIAAMWPIYWEVVKSYWENVIKPVWNLLKAGAIQLWNNMKAAWKGISFAIEVAWFAIKVWFEVFKKWMGILWDTAKAVSKGITKAWDFISSSISDSWTKYIKPVIDWFVEGFEWLGDGVMFLWHKAIEPAWNGIKTVISAVWDFLSPVFDKIGAAFSKVGEIAGTIADAIKTAWSGLTEVLKAPLHALGAFLAAIPGTVMGFEVPGFSAIHKWGTSLQGLATGGMIQGPGTGTSDSILGMMNGVPTVRVSNGEGIVPADAMATPLGKAMFGMLLKMDSGGTVRGQLPSGQDQLWSLLRRITRGGGNFNPGIKIDTSRTSVSSARDIIPWYMLGHQGNVAQRAPKDTFEWMQRLGRREQVLPPLSGGGQIGNSVRSFMQGASGSRYEMGAFGGGAFDCSGLVSAMVNTAMGRAWNEGPPGMNARMATASEGNWLAAQGFQKGLGPSGSLRVGFVNGGPGGGHTAGTLWDGTNFESSSGKGTVFGASALGASSGMFSDKYFLPPGPELPGGSSSGGASSYGSFSGGSSGFGSPPSGAPNVVDSKKVREAQDRVTDRQNQLDAAQMRLDEHLAKREAGENVKDSTIESATNQVEKFTRELEQATSDLETVKQGKPGKPSKSDGSSQDSGDWKSVGSSIFSGFLEGTGLNGSVLSNPFEWPSVKSLTAGINFGAGLLANAGTGNGDGALAGMGGDGSIGGGALAGIGDLLGGNSLQPPVADQVLSGATPAAGLNLDMRGANLGVSPTDFYDKTKQQQGSVQRRYNNLPG